MYNKTKNDHLSAMKIKPKNANNNKKALTALTIVITWSSLLNYLIKFSGQLNSVFDVKLTVICSGFT